MITSSTVQAKLRMKNHEEPRQAIDWVSDISLFNSRWPLGLILPSIQLVMGGRGLFPQE